MEASLAPTATPSAPAPAVWPATLPPMPVMDFAQFGAVETVALPRNQKLVASFLSRNWAQIPHVTHHDEACVDALEAYRRELAAGGVKLSPLPFLIKAAAKALA